jgi:predicted AAA+ superfamily ATPase
MFPRIISAPQSSFFLFGPRGTGKSTWIRERFPGVRTVDLLSEATYQNYLADPDAFAAEMRAVPPGSWVAVDEIQRLPNLLNEVHRFMEAAQLRFALCGSSARKLKRAGVNLLAGRAVRRAMHPFVPEELGAVFSLEAALQYGLLPVVWSAADRPDTLTAYCQMYLREEIQAEALVRNLPGFARFLPIAALSHGQAINAAGLARDAGVARTTVNGYLDVLEDTLMSFRLPAYLPRLRVRERRHPKLYWSDPGLVRSLKRQQGPAGPEERGALFEGLLAQWIRAYRDYRGLCDEFFYWASAESADVEVDFLLRRGGDFLAVEAKAGARFSDGWCRGLRAVAALPGLRRRMVVYPRGPRQKTPDGIEVVSAGDFARMLAEGTLWP